MRRSLQKSFTGTLVLVPTDAAEPWAGSSAFRYETLQAFAVACYEHFGSVRTRGFSSGEPMKTDHFLNRVTSFLVLSSFLIIYPVSSPAGVIDMHFVELGGGGITVNVFYSDDLHLPPVSLSFPGASADVIAGWSGISRIGTCHCPDCVYNVLSAPAGPISAQIIVNAGCGQDQTAPTVISFVSDSEGPTYFSPTPPIVPPIVEDGSDQFVGFYLDGHSDTVNLFVQTLREIPVPPTLDLLLLGIVAIGFGRRKVSAGLAQDPRWRI